MKSPLMRRIRQRLKKMLEGRGYLISRLPQSQEISELIPDPELYRRPGDFHRNYRPWEAPAFLQSLPPEVTANTMLPPLKIYMLQSLLKQTRSLSGAVLEAGVWNGGSARLIAKYLDSVGSTKSLWLLDTFEGYESVNSAKDGVLAQRGLMKGKSFEEVKTMFSDTKITVHIIKGAIPGTLCDVKASEISFAHVDVNLYDPTRRVTEFCLERMPRGGVIVFDDYGWPATYGARQAIDEVCASFGQETVSIPESCQAFLIRN